MDGKGKEPGQWEENRDRVLCCLHPPRFLLSVGVAFSPRVIITMLMVPAPLPPSMTVFPGLISVSTYLVEILTGIAVDLSN